MSRRNIPEYEGSTYDIGDEGKISVSINKQLLLEHIERLEGLNENRQRMNTIIENSYNVEIEKNNQTISEIDEELMSENSAKVANQLNQQKIQLLLLNTEYNTKILDNLFTSNFARVTDITGLLDYLRVNNPDIYSELEALTRNELATLQNEIQQLYSDIEDLNSEKARLTNQLRELQMIFENIIIDEEYRRNNKRGRSPEDDSYRKRSRYELSNIFDYIE
jgi:hypothetical protein